MKQQLTVEQQTLLDIITIEGKKIPRFINTKSPEHHHAFIRIQNVYEWIYDMAYPEFLSEDCIEIMYFQINAELKTIQDTNLNTKVTEYLLTKMKGYYTHAVKEELYEAAANFKRYLMP